MEVFVVSGRRRTFQLYTVAGVPLYAGLPLLIERCVANPEGPLAQVTPSHLRQHCSCHPPSCRCTWACSAWARWAASPSWAAPWPCCPRTRLTCTGRATWGRYTAACCSPPRPPRCSAPGCCSASATRRTPAPSPPCSRLSTPQHSPLR